MNTKGFLEQLLGTAQGALHDSGMTERGGGISDLGKGALAGGALGLLLGSKRFRKMGGTLVTYGGAAALGALAFKAYGDWQRAQRGEATAAPRTADQVPAAEAGQHSRAILKALVAAAKADGHVDARERELIETEVARMSQGDDEATAWMRRELERPLDPREVASAAASPAIASEMYLASAMVIDEQSYMERAYLDELARQMGLDAALRQRLDEQLATLKSAPAGG